MNDEAEKAFANLQSLIKAMEEREQGRMSSMRTTFFKAIPETTKRLYIHLSHQISENHPYVKELTTTLGQDNVLITNAPAKSRQSFYDNHLDATAHTHKTKQVITPFEEFTMGKSIDAIMYLCDYLCDGYQSPIFPEDVVTKWHIWRTIELAQKQNLPLVIGYTNPFCFGVKCYEREYITDPEKMKCKTSIVRI